MTMSDSDARQAAFAAISADIANGAEAARDLIAGGRQITTQEDADHADRMRDALATVKARAEIARDIERLPLIQKAQDVQAKWAPKLAQIKQADDVLRHALSAWTKRQRRARRAA